MNEEEKQEVKKAAEPVGKTSKPEEPKDVSSQEVKTEEKPVDSGPDLNKLNEQVSNLNVALKQERDGRRSDSEKIRAMEEERASLLETINTLKPLADAMRPKVEEPDEKPQGLTIDQLEEFYSRKEEERIAKEQETARAKLIENEIKELESKYTGANGGPKYDDAKVLQWQKDNERLYLTPKEAFFLMNQESLVDTEVKQRLDSKQPTEVAEQPTVSPDTHKPDETPAAEIDTRKAILEAMENAEAEE